MTFHDRLINSMTFQDWKRKFLNFMTSSPYKPCAKFLVKGNMTAILVTRTIKSDDSYPVSGKGSHKRSPKCDAFCLLFSFFGQSTFLMELRDFFIRPLNQSGKSWWVPKFQKPVLKTDYRLQSHLWHHISRFDCNMNYYKVTAWNLLFSVCLALALVQ